jgi:hypothetical protein
VCDFCGQVLGSEVPHTPPSPDPQTPPELACNATLAPLLPGVAGNASAGRGASDDPVAQLTRLFRSAPPGAVDPALLRVNARRFASVAVLQRALDALPPPRRAAAAATARVWLGSVPRAAARLGPAGTVLAYGWLSPFVCRVQLPDFDTTGPGGEQGTSFWMGARPIGYAMRAALRLDEPAAVMSALVGGESGRQAMRGACAAIYR